MKKKADIIFLKGAYIMMLMAMFIIPLFVGNNHSLFRDTLSEPGTYSSPVSWIINSIFILLALGSLISGWKYYEGFVFHRIILTLFSLSFSLAAIFNQDLVISRILDDIIKNELQSYFICNTWLAFTILAFSTYTILETQTSRQLAIITGISTVILSIMVSEFGNTAGIWQRLLLLISFGWMILTFKDADHK